MSWIKKLVSNQIDRKSVEPVKLIDSIGLFLKIFTKYDYIFLKIF